MGGARESTFEKAFIKKLKKLPNSYWPPKGDPGSSHGVPDRIGCIAGKFIALEFKRSIKEALQKSNRKTLQLHTLHEIQRSGGYGAYCYPEIADKVFKELKDIAYAK